MCIFKKVKKETPNGHKKYLKFMGITIVKKVYTPMRIRTYFCGILISSKTLCSDYVEKRIQNTENSIAEYEHTKQEILNEIRDMENVVNALAANLRHNKRFENKLIKKFPELKE